MNLFLKYINPDKQLLQVLDILNQFQTLSGLQTNVSKTKYALFGNAIDTPDIETLTGFSLEPNPFRLLGIYLTGELDKLDLNWEKAIKAMRSEIGAWSTMKLMSTAKVNITKTGLLSQFTHIETILPLPLKAD